MKSVTAARIRVLESEFVWYRKVSPKGSKSSAIKASLQRAGGHCKKIFKGPRNAVAADVLQASRDHGLKERLRGGVEEDYLGAGEIRSASLSYKDSGSDPLPLMHKRNFESLVFHFQFAWLHIVKIGLEIGNFWSKLVSLQAGITDP